MTPLLCFFSALVGAGLTLVYFAFSTDRGFVAQSKAYAKGVDGCLRLMQEQADVWINDLDRWPRETQNVFIEKRRRILELRDFVKSQMTPFRLP